MVERIVDGEGVPQAIGPYSSAVKAGGFVFVSGQIPRDAATGEMKCDSIEEATRQSLENLSAVLKAAGCSMSDVVKVTVYLSDMDEFAAMNEVYSEFFGDSRPARAAVEVSRLPAGAKVEIECTAMIE